MAALLGTKQTTYRSWERDVKEPNFSMIRTICKIHNVNPNDLIWHFPAGGIIDWNDAIGEEKSENEIRDLFSWDKNTISFTLNEAKKRLIDREQIKNPINLLALVNEFLADDNIEKEEVTAFIELVNVLNGWDKYGRFFSLEEVNKRGGGVVKAQKTEPRSCTLCAEKEKTIATLVDSNNRLSRKLEQKSFKKGGNG